MTLRALSFFSGAMGLDLGLQEAGIEVLLAVENDKRCRETIGLNKPQLPLLSDVNQVNAKEILNFIGSKPRDQIDLIVGGPPCQAFSTAGSRKGFNDDRGNVFLKFVEIIGELLPRYIVIENVRGLLSAPLNHVPHSLRPDNWRPTDSEKPGGALDYILRRLESFGYKITFNLYNTANFGVPQIRERVVICGTLGEKKLPFLRPTHSENCDFGLPKWKTVRDAFEGITTKNHSVFPEQRLKYYRLLQEGQYWKHLPLQLQIEAMGKSYFSGGGKTGFYRRLAWDKPSCTLVTSPTMPATDLCHPTEDRPISVEEYKRLQQFPDDWKISGNLADQYKQIGNAVPVGFGKAIGDLIISDWQNIHIDPIIGFPYSRYKNTDDLAWAKSFNTEIRNKSAKQSSVNQGELFNEV